MLAKTTGEKASSGRTFERMLYVAKRAEALKAEGHAEEAKLLMDALDVSIRGAYEQARLPDEGLFALCRTVSEGGAPDLVKARRWLIESARLGRVEGIKAAEPIKVSRCKDGMYRIASLHNHSSILVSAKDLLYLAELFDFLMPEIQEKANE